MILSPMNVELTKVHYFESFRKQRNHQPPSSPPPPCETIDNRINKNISSRRNILGQKSWTLSVNAPTKAPSTRNYQHASACILVALCLAVAIVSVIYTRSARPTTRIITEVGAPSSGRIIVFDQAALSVESVLQRQAKLAAASSKQPMRGRHHDDDAVCKCNASAVCLRQADGLPACVAGKDVRDPSGCAGLCAVNTEHCRLLDRRRAVYECVRNAGAGLHCPIGYAACAQRFCLHAAQRCDGRVDCEDFSDELQCACDLSTHFHCGRNTSCLAKAQRCDGRLDCWDHSDEEGCPTHSACPPGAYPCMNASGCFLRAQFCDGAADCADRSDEICF